MVRYIYKVDPENRSVACMGITKDNDGRFIDFQVGEAKCHKDDEFDVNFGMKLARLRCERNTIKRNMNKHRHDVSKFNKKSKYFEKCADVGVYNSDVHSMDYYGYSDEGVLSLDNWSIGRDLSGNLADRVTVVDKTSFALAPYKNIAFRIRIYIMTPQFSTINKYDLLATLKEVSIERSGDIDPGSQDLELSFSIVGETNEDFLNKKTSVHINSDKSLSKYKDKADYDEWGKSGGKTEAQQERDELAAKKKNEENAKKSSGKPGNSSKTGSRRGRGSSKTTARTYRGGKGSNSFRKRK